MSVIISASPAVGGSLYIYPTGDKFLFTGVTDLKLYNATTPWDIQTLSSGPSVVRNLFTLREPESVRGLAFNSSGTKLYHLLLNSIRIRQLNLSTPWTLHTAENSGKILDLSSSVPGLRDLFLDDTGTRLFIITTNNELVEYSLSTPEDIQTATSTGRTLSFSGTAKASVTFSPDGTNLYVVDTVHTVHHYSLSTPWNIQTATFVGQFNASPTYSVAFSPDGTRMFRLGVEDVWRYTLSTPWDITTAYEDGSPIPLGFGNSGQIYVTPTADKFIVFFSDRGSYAKFSIV